jgi:uncharacterized protein (DUF1015 family)
MAEIQPLRAVHYDITAAGPLDRVTAPPYDVIDQALRRELVARSPHNVVEIDLPVGDDPYRHAGELWKSWQAEGILRRDSESALWALEQAYTAPGGDRHTRRGFFSRVRVTDYGPGLIRPHERTHPAAKQDRLELMRATRANLSPIFSLYRDPAGAAWSTLEPALEGEPWGEVTDDDGTVHRMWRVTDPEVIDRVQDAMADRELLIADGHHRYETARTYADEVGAGAGEDARYTLACLVSLEDPGLSVFATHRLLHDLDDAKRLALRDTLTELFDLEPIDDPADLVPDAGGGTIAYGYMDSFHRKPFRLRLKDDAVLAAALPDASPAYRTLDAAALEALILTGPLAMSADDIAAKRGLSYCSDFGEAVARVERGDADAGFFLRPTPVQQVRDVADAGETMPPKSTYFYPKLLTGIVFNPLAGGKDG